MTATPRGPGRSLPASSITQAGFLQEDVTGESENGTNWVTAADVLAALAEITAAAEAAAGNDFTGQVTAAMTQAATLVPGGVFYVTAAITVTLPSASATAVVAGQANRQIVVVNNAASGAVTITTSAGTVSGPATDVLASRYNHARFDTDGTNWFIV